MCACRFSGKTRQQSSPLAEPLCTDPGLKSGISEGGERYGRIFSPNPRKQGKSYHNISTSPSHQLTLARSYNQRSGHRQYLDASTNVFPCHHPTLQQCTQSTLGPLCPHSSQHLKWKRQWEVYVAIIRCPHVKDILHEMLPSASHSCQCVVRVANCGLTVASLIADLHPSKTIPPPLSNTCI